MKENPARLRVVTYNIHKCVGLDRLRRPERVVKVLKEIDADIIGLQSTIFNSPFHKIRFTAQHDKNGTNKFMSCGQDRFLIRQPVLLSFLEV